MTPEEQEFCLQVERLVWRGRGLARLPDGKIALLQPGVFPGEIVTGVISRERRDYLEISWKTLLEPHPARRTHPCPLAGQCAGCVFGCIPNRLQLQWKQELFAQELRRNLGRSLSGCSVPHILTFPSQPAWRYRWRGQVQVHSGRPYFFSFQSHQLVPVTDCLLFVSALGKNLPALSRRSGDGRITVAANPLADEVFVHGDRAWLHLPCSNPELVFWLRPGVFFQANWRLNQKLIKYVLSCLPEQERVADLYAGAGNFALPLAFSDKKVLALEGSSLALQSLAKSVRENGLHGLTWRRVDLSKADLFKELEAFAPEAVVLDPPRMGCGKRIVRMAELSCLQKIIWVSCDLVNTCRDLRLFLQQGWSIAQMALFDFFPQTWHFEAVVVLERSV